MARQSQKLGGAFIQAGMFIRQNAVNGNFEPGEIVREEQVRWGVNVSMKDSLKDGKPDVSFNFCPNRHFTVGGKAQQKLTMTTFFMI